MIQSTADSSAPGTPRAASLLGALVALAATACGATVDAPDPLPEDPALVAIRERCPEIASLPRFCLTLGAGSLLTVFSPDDGRSCFYDNQNGDGVVDRSSIAIVGRSRFELRTGTISQYSFVKRKRPAYTYNDGEWSFLEDYGSGMLVTRSDNPHLQFYRSPPDPDSPWLDLWNTTGDEDLPVTVAAGRPFAALPGELWAMGEGDSVLHYELPSGILLDTVVLDTDGKDLPEHGFDVTADRRIIALGLYRVSSFDAATGALLARVTTENKPFGLRCWVRP